MFLVVSFKIHLTFSPCFPDLFHQLLTGLLSQNLVADMASKELFMACRQNVISRVCEILDNNPLLVSNLVYPEMHVIRCMPSSISATECPLALLVTSPSLLVRNTEN